MIRVFPSLPTPERISHELAQAHEELDSAADNLNHDRLNSVISSCYYACFHAARALLYHQGSLPATHKGVVIEFNRRLVKPGLLTKEWAAILEDLRDERELADYHSYSRSISAEEVRGLLAQAQRFVSQMEELIKLPPMRG